MLFVVIFICMMHWTIATDNPIDCDNGPIRLVFEHGLQGSTSGYDKGTDMMGSLAAQLPLYLGGNPAPADVDFDCVNKPLYNCTEMVNRAGAICSKCRRLGRGVGGNSAPHPVESYDQYGTERHEHYAEPGDVFDCVNKPEYRCPESVDRAGARCSTCRALNRGMGGSYYNQYGTGRPTHDAEYDEGDPQVLSHNSSRLDDD